MIDFCTSLAEIFEDPSWSVRTVNESSAMDQAVMTTFLDPELLESEEI